MLFELSFLWYVVIATSSKIMLYFSLNILMLKSLHIVGYFIIVLQQHFSILILQFFVFYLLFQIINLIFLYILDKCIGFSSQISVEASCIRLKPRVYAFGFVTLKNIFDLVLWRSFHYLYLTRSIFICSVILIRQLSF